MTKEEHMAALIAAGVGIDEVINAYGGYHAEGLQAYVEAVPYDDELEQAGDKFGMVSEGADPGAWVLAWVWVTNDAAGVEEEQASCEACGEEHPVDVLEDGLCPACVDRAENPDEDEEA